MDSIASTDESRDNLLFVNGSFLPGAGDMSVSVSSLHSLPSICSDITEAPPTPPSPIDHVVTLDTTRYLPGDSNCSFVATDSAHVIDNQYSSHEDLGLCGKKRQRCTDDEASSVESHLHKRIKKESQVNTNNTFAIPAKMSFLKRRMRKARQIAKMTQRIQRKFVNRKSEKAPSDGSGNPTCFEGETLFVIPNRSISTYSASDVTTDADETLTLFERQLSTMERCLVSNKVTFWRSEDLYPSDTE